MVKVVNFYFTTKKKKNQWPNLPPVFTNQILSEQQVVSTFLS